MRSYLEKRGAMAAYGWENRFRKLSPPVRGTVCSRSRQAAICIPDGGVPRPIFLGIHCSQSSGLKSFARLAQLQWVAANLAQLKDLD